MDITSLIIFLLIGALAGWIAGVIMKGSGFGFLGNIIVGVIGAVLGGLLFRLIGLASTGLIGEIITAIVGAIVLLYIVILVKRA
ncbi:GlsB/YeaQ/YmgE family stress response membrane protein [Thiohalophilus sp.]|uniref:GlsB/YeaQ/YmgE family stress response membrane protein n=1 Tax=Thiohalophilus sp. TaxID=3028392 RepID=UPI002ACEC73B|nr:GlsB/YeaQ/YmgE family stress response membrane protein [Thiohalophilus sp.]MDZ7804859.1 GlsB/YeaQ/YmgE family stress response membrane protein [Thiohalophilus sp.]